MIDSKELVLTRIRTALGKKPGSENIASEQIIGRNYNQKSRQNKSDTIHLFNERVSEYKAVVQEIDKDEISEVILTVCKEKTVGKLVIPPGLDEQWISKVRNQIKIIRDSPPLSKDELNNSDAVLTGCILGVAQTGTIVLDAGPGQGRRALTLLPDFHICVIEASQIVGIFPEGIRQLDEIVKTSGRPITMISGPSATSDIELDRVEGVHGPRKLHVLVVRDKNI